MKTVNDVPLFGPDMLADPDPVYERLRTTDPVHWHEPSAAWVVTRYDDVLAGLHDSRLSSDRSAALRALADDPELRAFFDFIADKMNFTDPPRHTRLRGLVNKAFTHHAVEALAPAIERLVAELLDAVSSRGKMDVITDFAYPLPGTVICRALGLPAEDLPQLKRWSDDFLLFFGNAPRHVTAEDYRRAAQSVREQTAYFRALLPQLRDRPEKCMLRALEQVEEAGDRLSEPELFATAQSLLLAGHETTTSLIGDGLLALLRHPEEMRRLRDDRTLIPSAVEEMLRYVCPVQFVLRQAREDLEIAGRAIREGQFVMLVLAAANRDPAHFLSPEVLDITRGPNKHLSFGQGGHSCPGMALARLEAQLAFEGLLDRLPLMRLGPGSPEYQPTFSPRCLRSLPVYFG
jgi:cytochrome P450